MRALVAVTVLAFACAAAAHAHEGGTHAGFASRVSTIEPFIPGLLVQVIGGHEKLSVTNLTEKRIVILDDRDQPLARIGPGKTEIWTDPRVGATEEPPEEEGLVRNWRIRGTADGEPFVIRGFLGYRPPSGKEQEGAGAVAWAIVMTGGAALVLGSAFAVALIVRRR